jgi:hypothetical protein
VSSQATKYTTPSNGKVNSQSNNNYTYGWSGDNGYKWNIQLSSETGVVTGGQTTLQLTFAAGKSVTLAASRPTNESGYFRKVILTGLNSSLSASASFGSGNTLTRNGETFEPSTPIQWGSSDEIIITLTNNTSSSISCTISSITVLTGTPKSTTFSWGNAITSTNNYDVRGMELNTDNGLILTGHCEGNTMISFPLEPSPSTDAPSITYSSNDTNVAEVSNTGIITIKGTGQATITATPQETDSYFYSPKSYSYNVNVTIDDFCGLIVNGIRVTTGNNSNILKDNGGSIASFDREKSELTLNGVALSSGIEYQGAKPLIIKVVGSNSISNAGNYAICMPEGIDILQKLIFTRESTDNESSLQLVSSNSVIKNFSEIEFKGALLDFNSQDVFYDTSSCTLKKADQEAKNTTISPAYPLWVEGTHVTSTNKDNILNDNYHTVSFDGDHTLSLNGAILSNGGIFTNLNSLTIKLTDASQISTSIADSTCIKSTNGGAITIVKDVNSTAFENLLVLHHYNGSAIRGISSISIGQGLVTTPETETPSIWINKEDYILITDNKQYDLSVGGIPVSENNRNHILGEGNNSVTYDPENNTLILNGANINGSNNGGLGECPGVDYYGEEDLKIKIYGTSNIIVGTSGCEGIRFNSMTGSPKLIFEKGDNNCSLTIRSEYETRSAICGFSNIEYQGLFIQSSLPCNYSESAKKLINPLNSSDSDPINEATITSTTTYQLWIGGEQVTSNNMSNGIVGITLELDNEQYNTITKGSEGVLSFNPEGNVLTLSNVTINPLNRNYSPIISNLPNLKVNINGHCTLSGFGGDIIRNEAFTSLYNSAPLVLSSNNPEDALMQIDVTRLDDVANGFDLSTSDGLYCGFGNTVIVQKLKSPSISLSNDILILNNSNLVNTGMEFYYKITDAQGQSGEDKKFETSVGSSQGINGPCTIEAWAKYGEQTSPHGIAKLFAYPTETSIEAYYNTEMTPPALVPEGLPSSATLSYDFSDFPDMFTVTNQGKIIPNALTDNTEGVPVMTSFTLSSELPFTILNDCYTENDVTTYYISNSFSIIVKPKELTSNMIQDIPNLMYNGSEIQPDISVKDGEKMLTKAKTADDGDYTISYSNNISAALSTANNAPTVTVTGKGNYTGTAAKTFTITAKSLADATVTLAENKTEFTYNEAANVPTITRVYLTEGAETPTTTIELTANDYTISYVKVNGETEEAIEADKIINAGSYKMILTGKGNFSGIKAVPFSITPRTITNLTFALSATSFTYNGEAQKPTVTVQFEETELEASMGTTKTIPTTDYDITYSGECINAATYTVSATLKGNYSGEGSTTFDITKATITPHVTIEGWTYGATANTPTISGNTGNGNVSYEYKLKNAADSEYKTGAPTEAGDYTIKATIAATANYEAAVDSTHFTIAKANITPTVTLEGWTFGATANTPEVTGNTGNGAETFTYKAEGSEAFTSEVPTAVGTHIVKVTIAETTNYNGGEATTTFTITNRTIDPANDITFAEGQTYASFYSSSEDLELPEEGIAVFMITGLNGNTLTTQAVSYIPKGVPVLVMKASGTTQAIDPNEVSSNMLQYATSDVNADGTTYILYNGEYVRATGTIPTGKCYLKLNKPSGARTLAIGNGTTGIDRLDNTVWTTENWFDLNGRRIEKPTKNGLYIMNGKKVVVK